MNYATSELESTMEIIKILKEELESEVIQVKNIKCSVPNKDNISYSDKKNTMWKLMEIGHNEKVHTYAAKIKKYYRI
jgi:hypothetical protein